MEEDAQTSRHVGYPPVLGEDLSGWLNSLQSEQQYATMTSLAARKRRPDLIKALCERGSVPNRLTAGEVERLRLMTDTVMAAPEIYRPSKFWQAFNEFAIAHLRIGGLANFKRSINQMYCNFLPQDRADPQLQLLRNTLRGRRIKSRSVYRIEHPDDDPNLWFTFYDAYRFFRGDSQRLGRLYLLLVASMYEYLEAEGFGDILAELPEPEIGNPVRVWRDGRLISQDIATSVEEFGFIQAQLDAFDPSRRADTRRLRRLIQRLLPQDAQRRVVGEVGAGYGRLGYVFLKRTSCRYWIFDIPPALLIAEWYLTSLFPNRKVFRFRPFGTYAEIERELADADVAFFTPDQLEKIPDGKLDLAINISSFHEMAPNQIKHFINLYDRKCKRHIYLKQYYEYHNPHDNLVLSRESYEFPASWKIRTEAPSTLNPRFFQIFIEKSP